MTNNQTNNDTTAHISSDTYSGQAIYLYSSKVDEKTNIQTACETLVASNAFTFALDSEGKIYFKDGNTLRCSLLEIESDLNGQGMRVAGHDEFFNTNPGDSAKYSFLRSLDLFLSSKKLFNDDFGFPVSSARIFMRPMALRFSDDEEYVMIIPHIRLYMGGLVTLSLLPISGFEDAPVDEVVRKEANKAHRNIESILCELPLITACLEYQVSRLNLKERLAQVKYIKNKFNSSSSATQEINFIDEKLQTHELLEIDRFCLSDLARNLLSMIGRSLATGKVHNKIDWLFVPQTKDPIGNYWHGKPIIFIKNHTRQKVTATENAQAHKTLIQSIMARSVLNENTGYLGEAPADMRKFDDFNHYHSSAISLMLTSSQLENQLDAHESYTFDNLISDIQVLNEGSHYINSFYKFESIELDKCTSSIDVARTEIKILKLEESLLSAHKFGEIAEFYKAVKNEDHLSTIYITLTKKIESLRKSLELDEKIASEQNTSRISIIFGIIASATLSPELIKPLAKQYNFTFGENLDSIIGIATSFIVVIIILKTSSYVVRSAKKIKNMLKLR